MASAAKKTYHHGDLRESLIAGAIALILEAGSSNLSLRQVARRVGVSHNAPYRHFADKEALLAAVAEQGFQSLRVAMEVSKEKSLSPPQKLQTIGIAYVKFALDSPAHYRVMFGEYKNDFSKYSQLATAAKEAFMVLVNTIQEGQTAGAFRNSDPVDLAQVAWSLVHGQAMLILDQRLRIGEGKDLDTFLQFSSQILLEGLAVNSRL